MQNISIKEIAKQTLSIEAASIMELREFIDESFVEVVHLLDNMKGRLVVSGIGKSAIIGQKIVATLNSTGTPSIFMHAADAIHGDLGMVQQDDIVMIISKSGESPEIKVLVTLIKNLGNKLIAMVGNMNSSLALGADLLLNTTVSQEACPNNLAPTSSTTAQLAMGRSSCSATSAATATPPRGKPITRACGWPRQAARHLANWRPASRRSLHSGAMRLIGPVSGKNDAPTLCGLHQPAAVLECRSATTTTTRAGSVPVGRFQQPPG